MANVICKKYSRTDTLPPDGQIYFVLGPDPDFESGAITVTAINPTLGDAVEVAGYLEVIQTATRRAVAFGGGATYFLDIVVRNNSHVHTAEESTITGYDVYVSIVTP